MTVFRETLLFQQQDQQEVPSWLVGLWRRLSIEENGARDTTTQVYWLQTSRCFGDIRIPAGRFAVDASQKPTAQQTAPQQDGFVGITRLKDDVCQWHHAMDYQPSEAQADTGRLYWEGDILVEVGPNESYIEKWQRVSTGTTAAMTCADESGWKGWLVVCGDQFIYMCNDLRHSSNCEISMGRVQRGNKPWEIQLSTLSWKEGGCLWNLEDITMDRTGQKIIQRRGNESWHWTVREQGDLSQQLALMTCQSVVIYSAIYS